MNENPPSVGPYPPHALGVWGEAVACRLLHSAGWTILVRGYRLGRREVDIIARRDDLLAFVEVKTRIALTYGPPAEAVTWRKRREIEAVAADYLMRHVHDEVRVRFDVVSVVSAPGRRVLRCEHVEDAWRPDA
jgi:putative endonuclease